MNIADTPAFPTEHVDTGYESQPFSPHPGMTLRDYFAAHAPVDIPDWFVHVAPAKNFPPMPDYRKLDEQHQQTALSWQRDPCFDLPEELEWYGEKVDAHRTGRTEWEEADRRARFVQWRWAYANLVIAGRRVA